MGNIVPATAGMRLTAAWLNQFIPGSWAACSVANSWTNHGGGSSPLSARLVNAVTMQVVGAMNPGTTSSGTTIGTLPSSAYYPTTVQWGTILILAGTSVGTVVPVGIYPNGNIQLAATALPSSTEVFVNALVALDV